METWLCPACLAPSVAGQEPCTACSAPLELGGRFIALEPLVTHGSSRTLGGIERPSGTPVIIKTLSISGLIDWKQLELFQRGIAVLRGLSHPDIPRHLGDGQLSRGGETIYYWVQERVPGRTLAAGLEHGQRWTEARARALADALLEILEYLQGFSPPILHRDLKPSNIIERPDDGGFVLIDFDLVKDTLDPNGGETTALGTAGYAPLEQLMGRAVPASDLYGLGATLVALLSRKPPADLLDEDASRIDFRAHVRVSEAFAGFLEQLLDPRASRRPADATAARALLRKLPDSRSHHAAVAGEPVAALVPSDTQAPPMVAVDPERRGVVILQTKLAQEHPAPSWVLLVRFSLLVGSVVMIPAKGVVLGVLLLVVWVVSGFVVRYRVTLPPGRALFKGGYSSTATPGTYWLRRRWTETACTIALEPLHLDWRPAPTRLEQGERTAWLELAVELWVEPCTDDLGQFRALLCLQLWEEHRTTATKKLRADVLDAVVEHVRAAGLMAMVDGGPVPVEGANVVQALAKGLRDLGLELRHAGSRRITLVPRTDDLETEDRLWIDRRPPPETDGAVS